MSRGRQECLNENSFPPLPKNGKEEEEDRQLKQAIVKSLREQRADLDLPEEEKLRLALKLSLQENKEDEDEYHLRLAMELSKAEGTDDLKKVLELSLDPEEQVNTEHREFLKFIQKKNERRKDNLIADEAQGHRRRKSFEDLILQGLSEEEHVSIALMRSKKDSIESYSSILSRQQPRVLNSFKSSEPARRLHPKKPPKPRIGTLRPIVIDGCNVAWAHGNNQRFSAKGLSLMYEFFKNMGHHDITIFVRSTINLPKEDSEILEKLKSLQVLTVVPESRTIGNRHISHYDDLMIVDYASKVGGIVVSRDHYQDIVDHSKEFKDQISNRLLTFSWVKDTLLLPQDPLGRKSNLKDFLRF